jgi:hypothetical protein
VEEDRAEAVVERLRARGVFAHVERAGVYQFGVRIVIPDGREAVWDTDGAAGLEAVILQDGDLVGYVPAIPGSEDLDLDRTVATIAATDYDAPPRPEPPAHPSLSPAAPPPAGDGAPQARDGGPPAEPPQARDGGRPAEPPQARDGGRPAGQHTLPAGHPHHRPGTGLLRRLSGHEADGG